MSSTTSLSEFQGRSSCDKKPRKAITSFLKSGNLGEIMESKDQNIETQLKKNNIKKKRHDI